MVSWKRPTIGRGIKLKAGGKVRGLVGPVTSRITLSERRVYPRPVEKKEKKPELSYPLPPNSKSRPPLLPFLGFQNLQNKNCREIKKIKCFGGLFPPPPPSPRFPRHASCTNFEGS